MAHFIVTIERDIDPDDPGDGFGWAIRGFVEELVHSTDPEELIRRHNAEGWPIVKDRALNIKLRWGLAFWLRYSHDLHEWDLWTPSRVHRPDGVVVWQCRTPHRVDRPDGVVVWEWRARELLPGDAEGRRRDAAAFLEIHNHWANGRCFGFNVEEAETGEIVEDYTCGYVGEEHLAEGIRESLARLGIHPSVDEVEFGGEHGDLLTSADLEVPAPSGP